MANFHVTDKEFHVTDNVTDKDFVSNEGFVRDVTDKKWIEIVQRGGKDYARWAWRSDNGKVATKGLGPASSLTNEQLAMVGKPRNIAGLRNRK